MKKKSIYCLLWVAFGVKAAYFVLMILVVCMQSIFRDMMYNTGFMEEVFYIPVDKLLLGFFAMCFALAESILIMEGLKRNKKSIIAEILGVVVFSGIFGWVSLILSAVTNLLVQSKGVEYLVQAQIVNASISYILPVSVISSTIFMVAAGMSIAYKKLACID